MSKAYHEGQILSVSRVTEEGRHILEGTFSHDLVAVPMMSLNTGVSLHSAQLPVQFQKYSKQSLFVFLKLFFGMVKRQDYILIYFPVLILLLKNLQNGRFVPFDNLLCLLVSLFFLIVSLRAKNHVADHLSGLDRLNPDLAHEPLMVGKVKAWELNQASYVSLGLGALFALPLIWQTPLVLVFLLPAVALGVFVQYLHLSKFKSDKWGEFFLFCLFGPLYISGLDLVLAQQIQAETFLIGFYIGLCSVYLLDLRVFSNFLFMSEVHSQNSLIAMGFDKSKIYLQSLMVLIVGTFVLEQYLFGSFFQTVAAVGLGIILMLWLGAHLRSCDSPVNSKTKTIKQDLAQLVYGLHLLWIVMLMVGHFLVMP